MKLINAGIKTIDEAKERMDAGEVFYSSTGDRSYVKESEGYRSVNLS